MPNTPDPPEAVATDPDLVTYEEYEAAFRANFAARYELIKNDIDAGWRKFQADYPNRVAS